MSTSSKPASLVCAKYHPAAYHFVDEALRFTQGEFGGPAAKGSDDKIDHITGEELLEGIRKYALQEYGLMTLTVFHQWGIHSTDDFGRIVYLLIDRGAMRKTDDDQLSDFFGVYNFNEAFDSQYQIDVSHTFRH